MVKTAYAVIAALIPLALLSIPFGTASGTPFEGLPASARKSIAYIFFDVVDSKTGAIGAVQGTGFVISPNGYMLSAAHLFEKWRHQEAQDRKNHPIRVSLHDKTGASRVAPLEVQMVDPGEAGGRDIAVLKLPDPETNKGYDVAPVCFTGKSAIKTGDDFMAFGFPLDQHFQPVKGILGTQNASGGRWAAAAAFTFGMSGGPVYDENGFVIGVIKGGIAGSDSVSWITPIGFAKSLLPEDEIQSCGYGKHTYLKDLYGASGALRPMGWGYAPPEEQIASQRDPLVIYPEGVGVFKTSISFVVRSNASAHLRVDKMYLSVKSYAPCSLRNDQWKGTAGDDEDDSRAFFLSEHHDVYPIKPINEKLTAASWTYKGVDSNKFNIRIESKPYVLYLYTVRIEFIDLTTGQKGVAETDQFAQIKTKGNLGKGCLDIDSWLKEPLKRAPKSGSYDEGVPFDIYALLTADFSENPSLINRFTANDGLVARRRDVESFVRARPYNTIFKENLAAWKKALAAKRVR